MEYGIHCCPILSVNTFYCTECVNALRGTSSLFDVLGDLEQFAAVKDVAEFVGSPLSDKDLCCIATEVSKDMGSHTTVRQERGHVTSRFGKWKVRSTTLVYPPLHDLEDLCLIPKRGSLAVYSTCLGTFLSELAAVLCIYEG